MSSCHVKPTDSSPVCPTFQHHQCYLVNLNHYLGFGVGSNETDIKVNQAIPSHASLFVKYRNTNVTHSYTYTNINTDCLVTTTVECKEVPRYHSNCFKFSAMRPSCAERETETCTKECHPSNKINFSAKCNAVPQPAIVFSVLFKNKKVK
jgi:hypothetical protein